MPSLPYSRKLLSAYGMEGQGWELLPLMGEQTGAFRRSDSERLAAGFEIPTDDMISVRDRDMPLGKSVFHYFPMRGDKWLDWLVKSPQHWDEVGLRVRTDGTVHGVIRYIDDMGSPAVAVTCALCHSAPTTRSNFHDGRATRTLDLGKARTLWKNAYGIAAGDEAHWGQGRIDVTDDGVNGPTAIPDLFGLSHARYLNCSGVIEVVDPAVPAMRFETQYILGHEMRARPARDLTVALANFLMSLTPQTQPAAVPQAFTDHCAGCHDPDAGFSGGLVDAKLVGTDTTAAYTPARGTGYYKVPSLLGLSHGGPYFHDASAETVDEVLERHAPLEALTSEARSQITTFLLTL